MSPSPRSIVQNAFSRMWLIQNGASPAHVPEYEGLWKAGRPTMSLGDVTNIYIPDPDEYGQFDVAGKIIGERGAPSLPVTARYPLEQASQLLRLARLGCDHDLQIHIGPCKDPQDFNGGWDKILVLEKARPTSWGTAGDMGALGPSERAVVDEEVPWSGEELYEILRIAMNEEADSVILQEVIDVAICDRVTCGECGLPSEGCQVVFALTKTVGGSPGLPAKLIYTKDGGKTWDFTIISTLGIAEEPSAMACVGKNLVVVSNDSGSLHYAPIAGILAGTGYTWTEVATGFVVTGPPNAIWSADPRHTFIVGDAGYIYFTDDPTSGVTVQDAGVATIQNLASVHGYDSDRVIAVGAANAIVATLNGEDWGVLVGPSPAVALLCVVAKGQEEWFVSNASGALYYTLDGGTTWVSKAFPGSGGTETITDMAFSTPTVGFATTKKGATKGVILRTIDGGYSWYVAPEANLPAIATHGLNAVAVCEDNPNLVYAGGLETGGVDGVLIKGSS